jgi:Uma2 family endonuclease
VTAVDGEPNSVYFVAMNQHLRQDALIHPLASLGANLGEGVTRRKWTGKDLLAMVRAGILRENDRIELLDGEIIALPPKGARHEIMRNELTPFWSSHRPRDVKFAEEPPLHLSPHDEPEPDIILFPASLRVPNVTGDTVLLVVEISDRSLSYDLKIKAPKYAGFGVREYCVIDPDAVRTIVHRDPGPDGFQTIIEAASGDLLTPLLVPSLAVRLPDLDIA